MSQTASRASERSRLVVLVTGMSGAGKTTVLKAFEDLGFEALDNMPLSLLPHIVDDALENASQGTARPIAVGIDIRTRDFAAETFVKHLRMLRQRGTIRVQVLFVDCTDEELLRRYTETRHRHPLAHDRPVLDGILLERKRISPLLDRTDLHLDTTGRTPYDAKGFITHNFAADKNPRAMSVFVTSFSYRRGIPRDADLVFDVRFLQNPHYDPHLKTLTGKDQAVQDYITQDVGYADFLDHLTTLLKPLVPRYAESGKSYLTIAVGCTGGRHRSVFIAEKLAAWLEDNLTSVRLAHRDLPSNEAAAEKKGTPS